MKISLALFTLYFASCVDVYEMIPCTSLHLPMNDVCFPTYIQCP